MMYLQSYSQERSGQKREPSNLISKPVLLTNTVKRAKCQGECLRFLSHVILRQP